MEQVKELQEKRIEEEVEIQPIFLYYPYYIIIIKYLLLSSYILNHQGLQTPKSTRANHMSVIILGSRN